MYTNISRTIQSDSDSDEYFDPEERLDWNWFDFKDDGEVDFDSLDKLFDHIPNTQQSSCSQQTQWIDKSVPHVTVKIRDVEVLFPYEPYGPQRAYMEQVIDALNGKTNALLQSPTGTGKTLCLLCATLAWIYKHRNEGPRRKIHYATRTLSQIKQVFGQLKKTCYRPITTYLCSRDHCCVKFKEEQPDLKGSRLTNACKEARKPTKEEEDIEEDRIINVPPCEQYYNLQKNEAEIVNKYAAQLLDIEDLYIEGKNNKFCPYFLERKKMEISDLIFMPYNYLMYENIRRVTKIDVEKSIIIFDEAHNIEKLAEESCSFDMSLDNLEKCSIYFDALRRYFNEIQTNKKPTTVPKTKNEPLRSLKSINSLNTDGEEFEQLEEEQKKSSEEQNKEASYLEYAMRSLVDNLETIKRNLQQKLRQLNKSEREENKRLSDYKDMYHVYEGREIFRLLKEKTSNPKMNQYKTKEGERFQNGFDENNLSEIITILTETSPPDAIKNITMRGLRTLGGFSKKVFKLLLQDIRAKEIGLQKDFLQNPIESYKLLVHLDMARNEEDPEQVIDGTMDLKVKMLCLNPGVGFSFARENYGKPHSLILTSGTLSPLKSFESELMIDFPIQFDNSHVIDTKTQCKTFVVQNGQFNTPISFTYENQKYEDIPLDAGHSLTEIAKLVPNGILVCFASKSLMSKCINLWNQNRLLAQLEDLKDVYYEPPKANELDMIIEEYKKSVNVKGAILFCYCRGKVSEGIDFANEMARAVVLIGIPLPPCFDPQIKLKKKFLSEKLMRLNSGLKPDEWYTLQATRAANQALGRVIRHIDDYGLVFLFEKRHNEIKYQKELPSWIKDNLVKDTDFETIRKQIAPFFESRKNSPVKIKTLQTSNSSPKKRAKRLERDRSEVKQMKLSMEKVPKESLSIHLNQINTQENIKNNKTDDLRQDFEGLNSQEFTQFVCFIEDQNKESKNNSQVISESFTPIQTNTQRYYSHGNSKTKSLFSLNDSLNNEGRFINYLNEPMEIENFRVQKCALCSCNTDQTLILGETENCILCQSCLREVESIKE